MERARAATPPDWLAEWIEQIPKGKALDIGAGRGQFAVWLAERGFTVEAVERDEAAARRLGRKIQGRPIEVVQADIAKFEVPTDQYTLILAAASLHFLHPEKLKPLAGRLVTGLKPNGYLMAEVFTTDDPGLHYYRQERIASIAPNTYPLEGRGGVIHYFVPGELRHLFEDLEVLEYEESRRIAPEDEAGYRSGATLVARRPEED